MRLIDADKIRYKDISGGQVPNGIWYCLLEDIEKQPTVKAIPIEWIDNYTRRNFFTRGNGEIVLGFMADMLDDWEKENEAD